MRFSKHCTATDTHRCPTWCPLMRDRPPCSQIFSPVRMRTACETPCLFLAPQSQFRRRRQAQFKLRTLAWTSTVAVHPRGSLISGARRTDDPSATIAVRPVTSTASVRIDNLGCAVSPSTRLVLRLARGQGKLMSIWPSNGYLSHDVNRGHHLRGDPHPFVHVSGRRHRAARQAPVGKTEGSGLRGRGRWNSKCGRPLIDACTECRRFTENGRFYA